MGQLLIHDPFVHLYLICLGALCTVHIYGFWHQAQTAENHSPTPSNGAGQRTEIQAESIPEDVRFEGMNDRMSAENSINRRDFHDVTA